ncbi:MAG: hypothetical protein E5X38_30365 [Mesorhizobium sp.]|uniref:hypothetical protein n=1 Tax=Mesorhizobium sp. TaxID=1871066 RepID=UPI0012177614|nr:hypothetical protein [Mesorhizobium sp.]TIN08561.1 MAG: hypothetical protein E5Y51_30250 [Mesorhizobium sp.]TIQ83141.1 MAG: hypothetical protein E5X38_30365 [Mesorhizobium sp.]TIQ96707.1 MAG: hypothetical protein E5X36_19305 [Mesorhizobium sp.]
MVEIATVLLQQAWPYLAAGLVGLAAIVTAYFKGKSNEKAKQAARDLAAAQERVEMNREATDIERQTVGLTDDQARKEAAPWVRQ